MDIGDIREFQVRFHRYMVPGQVFQSSSRRLILKGIDDAVFVPDSQEKRFDATLQGIANLKENLHTKGSTS